MPPAAVAISPAMHAPHHARPLPHMPPCHACPLPHTPPLLCTPPTMHVPTTHPPSAMYALSAMHAPPMDRMTDMCKNITFLQTSFAGGNNEESNIHY